MRKIFLDLLPGISEISNYRQFIRTLSQTVEEFATIDKRTWSDKALALVDGSASTELRRLVKLEARKADGIFFTGSDLARKVLNQFKPLISSETVWYDSACGAGNLLIAASEYSRLYPQKIWKNIRFSGTDIHREFIEAAKFRCLIFELLQEGEWAAAEDRLNNLYSFEGANGLCSNDFYSECSNLIINPPFNLTIPDESVDWSAGKVSAAALFVDRAIEFVNPGTSILAILPDVLRSGSRYEKWRKKVAENCSIGRIELLGQFDKYADVDVYAVALTKRKKIRKTISRDKPSTPVAPLTLDSLFDISVGTVVDNRDERKGPLRPYLVSKGLKGWTVQSEIANTRKHSGRSISGPFVVIKRTSRVEDHYRATATVINCEEDVYVDNHLIVAIPKSGDLAECNLLLNVLKQQSTNNWINNQIRCRHLTVRIVAKIPFQLQH